MIHRVLAIVLFALGFGMATSSLLGDFGFGLMRYPTSPTTLNQLLGSDCSCIWLR